MLPRALRAICLAAVAVAVTLAAPISRAGTTGKLTGTVVNEKKEPLAGANIRIEGQRLGAVSDDQGKFFVIGIPGGAYSVRANLLGYAPYVVDNVTITPDFTTDLVITLKAEAVQMAEVRVEAERPLLQKDATSTTRFLSAQDISRLPIRGYQEAAAQQSGIVAFQRQIDRESQNGPTLIVRGGRPNETAYYVDGFSQQDPLTGNSTTSINNNAIQEVVVLNGGFNAEYGRIMSGVVNVITREGADKYFGGVEAVSDGFVKPGDSFAGAKGYGYSVYDANFGGPIYRGKDWGTFYYSGQNRYQTDRAPKANFDDPLPSNWLRGWTHQAKLSLPIGKQMALKLGGLFSNDDWQEYLNTYRFNLTHSPRYADYNRSLNAQLNHTLNPRSFYSIAGNFFYTERLRGDGVYFNDVKHYGEFPQADLRTTPDPAIPWFWPGLSGPVGDPLADSLRASALRAGGNGHVFDDFLRRQSWYVSGKLDYTNQWNPFHQIKAGAEYDRHTLRFYDHYFPVNYFDFRGDSVQNIIDIDGYGFTQNAAENGSIDPRDGVKHPITASAYLQDKYERGGLVVNAGIRYDYLDVNTPALAREDDPLGADGKLGADDLIGNKTYGRVSPRAGIGFPVTDKTVMHLNWGQFYQQPNLQDLYVSYKFLDYKIQKGGYFVGFGNPNLRPEQTTAYEVGIAHQLSDYARLDVTAYYKDVKDLVQVTNIQLKPGAQGTAFTSYRNKDFATIKGVDFGFTLRRVNHMQANVAYSLSYALGTGSVSNTNRNIAWTADHPPKQTAPVDFDQRHKISLNLDYLLGRGEGAQIGGTPWFENTNVDVLYNIASGTPYTPTTVFDEATLAAVSTLPVGPINSRFGPWTQSMDLKVSKGFSLAGFDLSAYGWVINLFDTENAINVFNGTGSPFTDGFLNTNDGRDALAKLAAAGIDGNAAYRMALQSPTLFSNPRMIRFGLRMGF